MLKVAFLAFLFAQVIRNLSILKIQDIAWLAGLLEGEGSFGFPAIGRSPVIRLQMTDKDVVVRAARLLGVRLQTPNKPRKEGHAVSYSICAAGRRAIEWMMTIYVFMGDRRKEKIHDILNQWKSTEAIQRDPKGENRKALCHPDRPLVEIKTGFCKACYMKTWVKRTGKNRTYWRHKKQNKEVVT
jgi:hypothetical protein